MLGEDMLKMVYNCHYLSAIVIGVDATAPVTWIASTTHTPTSKPSVPRRSASLTTLPW